MYYLNSALSDVDRKRRTNRASELSVFRLLLLTDGLKLCLWYDCMICITWCWSRLQASSLWHTIFASLFMYMQLRKCYLLVGLQIDRIIASLQLTWDLLVVINLFIYINHVFNPKLRTAIWSHYLGATENAMLTAGSRRPTVQLCPAFFLQNLDLSSVQIVQLSRCQQIPVHWWLAKSVILVNLTMTTISIMLDIYHLHLHLHIANIFAI